VSLKQHAYLPVKGQKISDPGQIQDGDESAHVPEIMDCPGISRTDDHLRFACYFGYVKHRNT